VDSPHYQRIRLWSGITSIGANLALIWGLARSASWWAGGFSGALAVLTVLLAVAIVMTLANLPFDMLCGHAVEAAVGRTGLSASRWFSDWIQNRAKTLAGMWTGMLFFAGFSLVPEQWVIPTLLVAGALILTLFLLVPAGRSSSPGSLEESFEKKLEDELAALRVKPRPVRWFDHGDLETVNGCITPRGFLSLSTTVAQMLTPREAALMAAREECYRRSGTWILILVIVTVWTIAGILVARLMPSVNPVQAGLNGAAIMSTWCFLALFVWPTINRVWMKNADAVLVSLAAPSEVRDLLSKVERLNATDIALSPAKTAVFHPIPPLQDRLTNLDRLS
jgi:Zn-dependent protease with chaperone function